MVSPSGQVVTYVGEAGKEEHAEGAWYKLK